MEHIDQRDDDERAMAEAYKDEHGHYPVYPKPNNSKIIYPEEMWERDRADREHFHEVGEMMREASNNPFG